ncbi:ATP-binding protein [Devosia sp. XJ19-1]|uniref:ATP-binding protein n=1 Tax=Devosia ureilytica TaxID=2952754 RepID=A0A9Q4APZ4_9HYPH|nr:ATP-binding protein [Devosia ureilytica]MCP8888223.1 ATP-binding protein [Devosia ureilytica]
MAATLHIVTGLPGVGKSTCAAALEASSGAVRMEPDGWMSELKLDLWDEDRRFTIETMQWRLSRRFLAAGVSVIIEWGTWGREERLRLAGEARALGARTELYWLTAPLEVMRARIAARGRENPPITLEHIEGWVGLFQAPDAAELAAYDAVHRD